MKCPFCGADDTRVIDSRESEDGKVTRRRRECIKCHRRFTTYERAALPDIIVIKNNGTKEKFDREKIVTGLRKACEKLQVTEDDIERIADDVEMKFRRENKETVTSKEIGDIILKELRILDPVAYLRFAAVFKKLATVDEFLNEIHSLEGERVTK